MFTSTRLPRMVSLLLAVVIAVQPISAFSRGCDATGKGPGTQPTNRSHCGCCRLARQGGCRCHACRFAAKSVTPPHSCCKPHVVQDSAPATASCLCGRSVPSEPRSAPPVRVQADDQSVSALYSNAIAVEMPTIDYESWTLKLSACGTSASEQCAILCRLII
jgi:hypothetical protein